MSSGLTYVLRRRWLQGTWGLGVQVDLASPVTHTDTASRKFWRNELVRLKYHNPTVSMTVDRTALQDDPAVMSVHIQPEDSETEKIEKINMKDYRSSEILDALVQLTKASVIEPTTEDQELLAKLEEQRQRSLRDSKISLELRARVKREKEMLQQARGDLDAQST